MLLHLEEVEDFRGVLGCLGNGLVEFFCDFGVFIVLSLDEVNLDVLRFLVELQHSLVPELVEHVELFYMRSLHSEFLIDVPLFQLLSALLI